MTMTRRGLLGSMLALVGWRPTKIPAPSRRPWAERADELQEREGVYCDYVAWREWFERKRTREGFENPLDEYSPDEVHLYSLMCELADGEA